MKQLKRFIAMVLAAVMISSFASCSEPEWIAKYNGETVPVGAYTYYVYSSYVSSLSYGEIVQTEAVKDQTIGEENAADVINNAALESVKYLCEISKRYNDAGLSLEESKDALAIIVDGIYEDDANKKFFEDNGVAKTSVLLASNYGFFGKMEEELFTYTYGEGGPKEVSDEGYQEYFKENYVRYSFVSVDLADSSGAALEGDDKQKALDELDAVKKDVEAGTKKFDDVAEEWKAENDASSTATHNGSTVTVVQKSETDLMKAVLELEEGEMGVTEIGNIAYLLYRQDLEGSNYLDDEENRFTMLQTMKYEEFKTEIENAAKAADIEINTNAAKKFGISKLDIENQK